MSAGWKFSAHRATYACVSLRHPLTGRVRWLPRRLSALGRSHAGDCWKSQRAAGMIGAVADTIEALERRIDELRVAVREAVLAGDRALAGQRRSALRSAERAWEDALDEAAPDQTETSGQTETSEQTETSAPDEPSGRAGSLLPLREQVYEALSLL